MAKLSIVAGTTSKTVKVFIQNNSVTTGAGLTGLAYNTASLTAYYIKEGDGSTTAISLVTATLGTWTSSGFIVVDATNMPGVYELGLPNAAIASGKSVLVYLQGAANMAPLVLEIELTAINNQSTGFGLVNASANVAQINGVATTSVTTVSANQGTTQPVNFSGTGSTAYVKSDTEQLNAQAVTAAAGVTFPASVASPTNITAGTITTVTNLTNAPTAGDFTATMKTSLNSSTPASVTTVTGNVNGSVGSVTGAVGSVTGNVGGNVTGSVGSISGVTFPTNFSVFAIDGSGFITYNNAAPPSAASIASTLLGTAVDGSFTVAQSARLVNAALWGQISGAVAGSSGTALLQSASTSATTRLTITYDSNGNRTGVTVNNDS